MINSRKLEDLDPIARKICQEHVALCKKEGIELIICSTYRDYEEQDKIYAQGRTTPGKQVTKAKAGESYHNFRAAWDCVPLVNGKADWNQYDPIFQRMIDLGIQAGASAGAKWTGFKDHDHFEVTHGLNIKTAKANFDKTGSMYASELPESSHLLDQSPSEPPR